MKTRKKLAAALVSSTLILLLAGDVLARSGRMPHAQRIQRGEYEVLEPGEMRLERMTQRLNLTEEQKTAIGGLIADVRKKNLELRKQLERVRHELKGEMLKDKPDERTVVELTERIGKLRTDLRVNRVKNELAVRTHLSPEQRDAMLLMGRSGSRYRGRGAGDRHGRPQMQDACPLQRMGKHPRRGFERGPDGL